MFLHYFLFDYNNLSKGKSCQLKLTGKELTKLNKYSVEKHDNTS